MLSGTLTIDDGIKVHQLSLGEAMQHGYSFLADGHHLVFQAAFTATGVVSYKRNHKALYTAALKLTYGPPEHRLTVESRMLCVPGNVWGKLPAPALRKRMLCFNKDVLQLHGESCPGVQSYLSSLKLTFHFHGETVAMVMHPECPCDQLTPIGSFFGQNTAAVRQTELSLFGHDSCVSVPAAACTRDGYMDFEVLAGSTTPPLVLDTLRLRDPTCKPASRSPWNDRAWFHVPLSGCGTRYWLEGEKIMYENEVRALRSDRVLHRISRHSEFRLTVLCSFSNGDASVSVRVDNPPPLAASMNQGPLSLILLSYPEDSYRQPYHDNQYPIVRYLQQPIFMEVQVLNRNDPNLYLQLDDCWATASEDPKSLPQWNIVVDGCEYEQDSYRTVFHPVGHGVSYPNYRQRLEVKAFAFVSGDKALPGLVYFHCSVLICSRFQLDSPLCTARCPRLHRSKRGSGMLGASSVVSLQGPVLLVPHGWAAAR
ncbi:hypothetical protein CIB84_007414, partial [Bambusicola thoracicus]